MILDAYQNTVPTVAVIQTQESIRHIEASIDIEATLSAHGRLSYFADETEIAIEASLSAHGRVEVPIVPTSADVGINLSINARITE